MLEMILDKHVIWVIIGLGAAAGVVSKCIVNVSLKRLVRGAGNMGKSTHPFMRLVRAKFEHACMVSEKVENVEAFVDKYLYEYRVAGLKLHSLQRMEVTAVGICMAAGLLGGFLEYTGNGMNDEVLTTGAFGIGAGILLYLLHLTTDEKYSVSVVRNYMVDYLENVCLHRYEKAYQKETESKGKAPQEPDEKYSVSVVRNYMVDYLENVCLHRYEKAYQKETESKGKAPQEPQPELQTDMQSEMESTELPQPKPQPKPQPELTASLQPEPIPRVLPVSDLRRQGVTVSEQEKQEKQVEEKKETPAKEVLIRQILEEFMA